MVATTRSDEREAGAPLERGIVGVDGLPDLDPEADGADLGPFVDGTEEVLRYYLASRWFS